MARMHTLIAVSLLSFISFGCVSMEKYNAARMDADRYATQLSQAERDKQEAIAARDAYKQQLDNTLLNGNSKDALTTNQAQQIAALQQQYDELNRKYAEALKNVGQPIVLPQELNDALKQFAAQNPDIVEFDSARGMVKFKSDVTFATGSAKLTSTATPAIDRFAQILTSPAAMAYELMVVGHTDNTRVARPETIREGHKDNWYLSAHRAISVGEELQRHGVSAARLEVGGYADQRPIASNATESGKAQNRRVEVLILPSTIRTNVAVAPSSPSRTKVRPALNKDENKDFVDTNDSRKPALNK